MYSPGATKNSPGATKNSPGATKNSPGATKKSLTRARIYTRAQRQVCGMAPADLAQPTVPSNDTLSSFCASTANSMGSFCSTSRA